MTSEGVNERNKKVDRKKKVGRTSLQEINENSVDYSKACEEVCLDSERKHEFSAYDSFGNMFCCYKVSSLSLAQ